MRVRTNSIGSRLAGIGLRYSACCGFVTKSSGNYANAQRFTLLMAYPAFACAAKRYRIGGAKEDRTPDLLRARQALSQLSYGPSVVLSSLARSPYFPFAYFLLSVFKRRPLNECAFKESSLALAVR